MTQVPLYTMQNEEAGCLGAAMLAGKAVGIYPDLQSAVNKMVTLKQRYDPDSANASVYQATYDRYVKLYDSLLPLFATG